MNFEMRFGAGSSTPIRRGSTATWAKLGDLVEEAASAPSIAATRGVVAAWLEREVGTSSTFIGRVEEGRSASYSRNIDERLVDRLFGDPLRYVAEVEEITERIFAARGSIVCVVDDARPGPLIEEIFLPTGAPVAVMTAVPVPNRPLLRAFIGHERVYTEDRAIITACLRILAMAELVHDSPPSAVERAEPRRPPKRRETLTEREREVLEYLALGYTNSEVAMACGNAPNTVKKQIAAIFSKLGASTRAECVRIAILEGHVVRHR